MVSWSGRFSDALWIGNGGQETLDSYYYDDVDEALPEKYRMKHNMKFDQETFDEHKEWMADLPLWLHFPELKINGREVVASHSHISSLWRKISRGDDLTDRMLTQIM